MISCVNRIQYLFYYTFKIVILRCKQTVAVRRLMRLILQNFVMLYLIFAYFCILQLIGNLCSINWSMLTNKEREWSLKFASGDNRLTSVWIILDTMLSLIQQLFIIIQIIVIIIIHCNSDCFLIVILVSCSNLQRVKQIWTATVINKIIFISTFQWIPHYEHIIAL